MKEIRYRRQIYKLDTEAARQDFYNDLTAAMDRSLYEQLSNLKYDRIMQGFFMVHILCALEKLELEKDTPLNWLRVYCKDFHRMLAPGTVFRILYYCRRNLYHQYLLRISEETAFHIMERVVSEYENERSTKLDYPFPFIEHGELLFFRDLMDTFEDDLTNTQQ